MKMHSDYAALLEECFLLILTSAAFYLDLSKKTADASLSGMLVISSKIFERHALTLSGMTVKSNAPHLNPAYAKCATDNPKADLETALNDIFVIKTRLLYLAAYAPDASDRHTLIQITSDVTLVAGILSHAL